MDISEYVHSFTRLEDDYSLICCVNVDTISVKEQFMTKFRDEGITTVDIFPVKERNITLEYRMKAYR